MFKLLSLIKLVLYTLVLVRALGNSRPGWALVLLAVALVISGLYRSYHNYENVRINYTTMILDLFLAFLFSLFTHNGSFDKLYIIYLIEGIAVLPKPFAFVYAVAALAASAGATALYDFRHDGVIQAPEIAQVLLYCLIIILVAGERRQREQKLAYAKMAEELGYTNLQLQESLAWSQRLACEAERRRLADEIHDDLGHHLTGLILSLEAGKKLMEHDPAAAKAYWDKALDIARTAIRTVRELVATGKNVDSEFELVDRLQEMVKGIESLSGLKINCEISGPINWLSAQAQFSLYRIFQEAFTNTIKHANADCVSILLAGNEQSLHFSYKDNGCGTAQIIKGNGLNGMIDRASEIGGKIDFISAIDHGFEIAGAIARRGRGYE
ncbi:MAG: sensor histidine kinase [Syntrophomonas sp.]